ncbi:MAG: hypothetical protein ACOYOU_01250 [Kiritimatiellia bacterium]
MTTTSKRTDSSAAPTWLHGHMPLLLLLGGLLAIGIFYGLAVARGAEGHPAPAQTDALVYLQYARAIAEGHAYVFTVGETPSTGSTSHLYPALLAIPCLLGARGAALLSAAFCFNALCYLIWLQVFWLVARRVAPRQAVLASGLALLNGQLLVAVTGLTDMALFTLLSWGLLAALLYARSRLAALLLILTVLARPEGMLLAVGLAALGVFMVWQHDATARRMLGIAGCGLAAMAAVFTFNLALTGFAQFQSISQKGYLQAFPLLDGLGCTARDFGTLVSELLLNSGGAPRQAYFLPVAGGLLSVAGVIHLLHTENHTRIIQWWLGASLASFGLIAMSSWQGVGTDRYLLWLLPTWYLLAACGAGMVAEAVRLPRIFPALAMLLIGYELATWPYFASRHAAECVRAQSVINISRSAHALLPPQASVGVISGPSLAYALECRPVRHLAGITSPAFARQRDMLCAVETLRHHPEIRFTHFLLTPSEQAWCAQAGMLGDLLLNNPDAPPDSDVYELCSASWDAFSAASLLPMNPAISRAVATYRLVEQLDIGYLPDERRCRYRVGSRLPGQSCRPCVASRRINDQRITEVGQPVLGWDEFRVRGTTPGQPMFLVMRTTLDATCTVIRATERIAGEGLHLRSPIQLRPIVNNQPLPLVSLPVTTEPDTFSEHLFEIPAEYVTSETLAVELAGDHIALGYWFYQ